MRKIMFLLSLALLMAACSTPKYTYHFDHYDYNSGKKDKPTQEVTAAAINQTPSTTQEEIQATAVVEEKILADATKQPSLSKEEAIATLKSLSKEEKKEMKKDVKKYVKENKMAMGQGSGSAMSGDLKLAAILGVIGVVLLIIGGDALTIIGSVALLVGLFFFVRWLINNN